MNNSFLKSISILFFLFPIFNHELNAQANTLVMGKIKNVGLVKKIDLQVNQKYLNNQIDIYTSNVLEDGSFAFPVQIEEAQVATLLYSRNPALIYLEPNDTLIIESDVNSFQYSLKFSGRSGYNNAMFFDYLKDFPQEMDPLKFLHYRKGNYYFINDPVMDKAMQNLGQASFTKKILLEREEALMKLNFYHKNNPSHLTAAFQSFLKADIYYKWAYHMMLYGSVYNKAHQIDQASFFTFLDDVNLQQQGVGNYWYRQFLFSYFNYLQMKNASETNLALIQQYNLASDKLQEKAQIYFQSEIIKKLFAQKMYDEALPLYIEFLENNPYASLDEKVITAYQKALKHKTGSVAADFELKNEYGILRSLASFKGQVVYLNFWASWCRPCIRKMTEMKHIQDTFQKQGVVFVNISIDSEEEKWKKAIEEYQFKGIHLLAPDAQKSKVAMDYEVKALPQYFLINKFGRFADKPMTYDLYEIQEALKSLIQN